MLNVPEAVKTLFKTDGVLKNIRVSFPNGEYNDICNDRIIKESLKFDESISSRQNIKFGLCESSQLSFECVGIEDIKGLEIEAYIEIDTTGTNISSQTASDVPFPFYRLPLGRFLVDESKLDSKMLARKVVAYSTFGSFSLPRYLSEISTFSEIHLNIMHYLYVISNGQFLDENRFEYTPVSLSFGSTVYTSSYSDGWRWIDDQDISHDFKFDIKVKYKKAAVDADDAPDMRVLFKCVDNGISSEEEEEIVDNLEDILMYVVDSGYTDPAKVRNMPKRLFAKVQNFVKNMIKPLPYMKTFPTEYLVGIDVGDIYPPSSSVMYVTELQIALMTKLSTESESSWVAEKEYTFENESTPSVDYEKVSTTYYPGYSILLQGEQADTQGYYYQYFSKFLNLDNRKLLESCVEILGKFGRMNRYGYFEMLKLAEVIVQGLFPSFEEYPRNILYPMDYGLAVFDSNEQEIITNNEAIDLWYEKQYIGFERLICRYMSSEVLDGSGNPVEVLYETSWEDEGLLTYDVSDNYIIRDNTWTASQIEDLLVNLVISLQDIKFYPAEVSMVGLPYIEAGDEMLVSCHGHQLLVLNLSRTLNGIQALRDKAKTD